MRQRIKTGVLVASTNLSTFRELKRHIIQYKYSEKLFGNKIIKINIIKRDETISKKKKK